MFKLESKERHAAGKGGNQDLDSPDYSDLRLPAIKGSRALITGSICFRVGLNLTSYNRYLVSHSAQTKMDESETAKEANNLVLTLFHCLRDKFCVAQIYCAGLITACVSDAHVFMLNHIATRHNVHKVWDMASEVVRDLVVTRDGCHAISPNAAVLYRRAVATYFPEWETELIAREVRTKRVAHVQRFLQLCQEPSRAYLIAHMAAAARWRWIAKVDKNRNKDCSSFPELKHAPVNTDTTESGIGALDYNLFKSLASFTTTFGVVQSQRMQIFATEAGKLDRQNRKKRSADHVQQSTKWDLTSYYKLTPEKRESILRVISRLILAYTRMYF